MSLDVCLVVVRGGVDRLGNWRMLKIMLKIISKETREDPNALHLQLGDEVAERGTPPVAGNPTTADVYRDEHGPEMNHHDS